MPSEFSVWFRDYSCGGRTQRQIAMDTWNAAVEVAWQRVHDLEPRIDRLRHLLDSEVYSVKEKV